MNEPQPHKGWHSRGYLPHFDAPDQLQFITFHLADSVPRKVLDTWKQLLGWNANLPPDHSAKIDLQRRIEKYADEGYGECHLRDSHIATTVEETLLKFDAERYHLLSWCIMPNHVHTAIEVVSGNGLDAILHSWKSYTAKQANRLLGRTGTFWMPEYFDRYIRDNDHVARVLKYIEDNPVRARLVKNAWEWRFSSAAYKRAGEGARGPST